MEDRELTEYILKSIILVRKEIRDLGKEMFILKTQHGLPPDFFFIELDKKIKFPKICKFAILDKFLNEMTEHKLKSGVEFEGKNHKKLQERNKRILIKFIETEEVGIF